MGTGSSRPIKVGVKVSKTRVRKGGKVLEAANALITLPLDLRAYLAAETVGSCASAFERGALGLKHLSEAYTNFMYQPGSGAPSVHVFSSSIAAIFQGKDYLRLLTGFLQGVQVVAPMLEVLGESELKALGVRIANELAAQTGLSVPAKFADHVYKYAEAEANRVYGDGLQHLYFLFHPDNNWHPEFHALVRRRRLPNNLVAMSESLDCLVVWMRFIRDHLDHAQPKVSKATVFHLIMPAYEPTVIKDLLEFPDVGHLMIHGETCRQQPLMWLNLPTIENYPAGQFTFKYIGNIAKGDSSWKDLATAATGAGVFTAATTVALGAAFIFPPALFAWPIAAGLGSLSAAAAVEKKFSKEVPRILGAVDAHGDCAEGVGKGVDDGEGVTVQPGTKHVTRRKHQHGHSQPHQRS